MSANLYEMLLRHPQLLSPSTLILSAESELPSGWSTLLRQSNANLYTWDWLTAEAHKPLTEPQIRFGIPELNDTNITRVILLWPKSKTLALALLELVAATKAECWAIGANDTGGKSIGKAVQALCTDVTKTDSARHCTLWQLTLKPQAATNWLKHAQSFKFLDNAYLSLPGVFNHGKLDVGTSVLLEYVPPPSRGKVLDLGCGTGVIGLSMKARSSQLTITLADVDAFALQSARLNSARLNLAAEVITSDGLNNISGRFDFIFTNPPFHQGKETDYNFARNLFAKASKHLTRDGQLWIVANRHLHYEEWAAEYFSSVNVLAQEKGFKLLCVSSGIA